MSSDEGRRTDGMRVRREVLGDAHVDRAVANVNPDDADFQDITRVARGDIRSRPGLDRRSRSIVALTAQMTAGYWEEVPMHFRAAITNGLAREEVREIILQVSPLPRLPVANHGTTLLRETLEERDLWLRGVPASAPPCRAVPCRAVHYSTTEVGELGVKSLTASPNSHHCLASLPPVCR